MSHDPRVHSRELDKMIERQIRNWELARQQKIQAAAREARPVEEFVAISRAVGLDCAEVIQALHDQLGWPVFDRQVLQAMAGGDDYRRRLYATMDERDLSWLEECLRSMGEGKYSKNDYFHRLRETILSLARKGHTIFVGRAADLILPRSVGLRVRLTASRAYCIKQYSSLNGVPADRAEEAISEMENERAKFILHHFGVEAAEATRYDLIINMERMTARQAAALMAFALRDRGMDGPR